MSENPADSKHQVAGDKCGNGEFSDDDYDWRDYNSFKRRIDTLLPKEEEKLRAMLNERHRQHTMAAMGFNQNPSQIWRTFIERLESGNIDEDIKGLSQGTWNEILNQMGSMVGKVNSAFAGVEPCEPEKNLEQICEGFRANLVSVRQAVACAIATEKELERQLECQQKMTASWGQREEFALGQGDNEVAAQAKLRQLESEKMVGELQASLEKQRDSVCQARLFLTECEQFACRSEVRLRSLKIRDSVSNTMGRVLEALNAVDKETVMRALAEREAEVRAKEDALAKPLPESEASEIGSSEFPISTEALLLRTVLALEKATLLIEKMEKILGHGEDHGREKLK